MTTNNNRRRHFKKMILFIPVFAALVGLILMLLWNWLLPGIFKLPEINFLQALGLLLLSKILFSGFGRGGRPSHFDRRAYWEKRFQEKTQTGEQA